MVSRRKAKGKRWGWDSTVDAPRKAEEQAQVLTLTRAPTDSASVQNSPFRAPAEPEGAKPGAREERPHVHLDVDPPICALVQSAMTSAVWADDPAIGWLYAGIERKTGNLKFGGTRQCPYCRAKESRITVRAFSYSPDWHANEQRVLRALGPPVRGLEWFDDAEGRLAWLIAEGLVHDVRVVGERMGAYFAKRMAEEMA